jgi:hypothetical protein
MRAKLNCSDVSYGNSQLRRLDQAGLPDSVNQLFHSLRLTGDRATHEGGATRQDASTELK